MKEQKVYFHEAPNLKGAVAWMDTLIGDQAPGRDARTFVNRIESFQIIVRVPYVVVVVVVEIERIPEEFERFPEKIEGKKKRCDWKLKEFTGIHILTGCQYGTMPKKDDQESDPNTLDFILDGRVFSVVENPDDGYRSMMDEIIENRLGVQIKNTFVPCEVAGVFRKGDVEIIDFYDTTTGRIVMSIGTEKTDVYYPCFVGVFHPENMAINKDKKEEEEG